jgi:predicted metal-dependent phosphoesterase TrpH
MAIVDLHIHSNRSDGEYAPARVVRLAARAGLRVMALTDHDTTEGIAEAIAEAAVVDAGTASPDGAFVCLPGVEISTAHAREQHILGYLMDIGSEPFRDFMKRLMALRRERAHNILAYLKKRGAPLSYERVRDLSGGDYIGRPQIAGALVRTGKARSIPEAFARYLTGGGFARIARPKPSAEESIARIRAAGGTAVLAHPYTLGLEGAELEAQLKLLKGYGLRGLECHYGTYDIGRTRAAVGLADKLGLIVTGGSDFHGPHIKPGVLIATGTDGMLDFNDRDVVSRLRAAANE